MIITLTGMDAENSGPAQRLGTPWWLLTLYAVLALAIVSLAVLLLQDLLVTLEEGEHEDAGSEDGLHHLFFFDLAWPVFLITSLITAVGGLAGLIAGAAGHSKMVTRYGIAALVYVLGAGAILFVTGALEL